MPNPDAAPAAAPAVDLAPAAGELARPDEEGRLAYVLDFGGQIAWLHDVEAPAAGEGRRATARDLAIAGQA